MANKRSKRPVYQLPPEPAVRLGADDLRDAAADLYGFQVTETRDLLRAKRKSLEEETAKQPKKIAAIKELSRQATVALELPAAWSLGDERWALATEAGIDALDKFQETWVAAAKVRIDEIHIDANHSTPNLRKSLNKAAETIQDIIDRWEQLRLDLRSLRREPPSRGVRLARWQALLHDAGFTWHEVSQLFAYAPKRDGSPEAARKRVKKLLDDPFEAERHRHWLERINPEEPDI